MATKPRTPRYFPRMKVRGQKRRRLAPWHRLDRSFDRMSAASAAAAAFFADLTRLIK